MVFSSVVFLFYFLPAFLLLYLALPAARNTVLLIASLLFYAWGEGEWVLLLLGSIAANWAFGRMVASPRRGFARGALVTAVAANLGLLAVFKYAHFGAELVNPSLVALGILPLSFEPVHLPIGISFFTFHAISYVVDV